MRPGCRHRLIEARRYSRDWSMAYISGRVVHDADAHIMETPFWLRDHADPDVRDRIPLPRYTNELKQVAAIQGAPTQAEVDAVFADLAERHRSDEFVADEGT